MEDGQISIDKWTTESQHYFLTHLHSDHTQGLSSKWDKGPLYCSPITAKLIPPRFPGFKTSLIRVLEIGSTCSFRLVSPSSGLGTTVQVTPIDAHHCPGAVMYLFRGEFGCMLYTGDFRWETTNGRSLPGKDMLLDALGGDKIDFLYLDNTYCNPSFSFPPREVAAQQVVDIISSNPDHDIVICIDKLGKEDLLLHISKSLKTKIWVWPQRLQTMHLLGFYDIFTTKTCLTRIRAVPRYSFTFETLEGLNTIKPTIGIRPSGLPWVLKPLNEQCPSPDSSVSSSPRMIDKYTYSVLYSEHSCFDEIKEFIKLVRPSSMSGFVSPSQPSIRIDPCYYFGNLCENSDTSLGSDHLSKKSRQNKPTRDRIMQVEPVSECSKSEKIRRKRERTLRMACLGVQRSRVNILRQRNRGAIIL